MPNELMLESTQTLGSRVRAARKHRGLKQKDLASRIGCQGGHLSDIEGDRKQPSLEILKRISEELDITVDFFLLDTPHSCKAYLRDAELGSIVEQCSTSTLRRIVHAAELFLEQQQEFEKIIAQYEDREVE